MLLFIITFLSADKRNIVFSFAFTTFFCNFANQNL